MQALRAALLAFALAAPATAPTAELPPMTFYKTPQCGCCDGHADYLREHGFKVTVIESPDLPLIKQRHGIPEALEGCHTIEVGGYVVEGHVTIDPIRRLLRERPAIKGISLPGMPTGSPGMNGPKAEPFVIYEIGAEKRVFAVE